MGIKKFISLCALFIALVFSIDFLAAKVLSHFVIKYQTDKRLERLLDKKEDSKIVVFGSSRAARNINTKIIAEESNTTAFNHGVPGSNIDYHETLLQYLVNNDNCQTKLIILVLDECEEFFDGMAITFRLDKLYPWANYAMAKATIKKREPLTYLSLSKSYSYKKCDLATLYSSRGSILPVDTVKAFGAMTINFKSITFDTLKYAPYANYDVSKENPELIKKFLSFVNICKEHNMNLLLLLPPNYFPKTTIFKERLAPLIAGKTWVYLYEEQNEIFKSKEYYYDKSHLDSKGAALFTKSVANFIKSNNLLSK